jgi:hypothetical protein
LHPNPCPVTRTRNAVTSGRGNQSCS